MSAVVADTSWSLKERRMLEALNARHGIVSPPEFIQRTHADVPSVFHVGVPIPASSSVKSASGGVGHSLRDAALAASGEALERYAAASVILRTRTKSEVSERLIPASEFSLFSETQRSAPGFPASHLYGNDCEYVAVEDLMSGEHVWVPASLVALRDVPGEPVGTSNGAAAGPSPTAALLRAVQELVERDALMTMWQHSIGAPQVPVPEAYRREFEARGGRVTCFNFTPAYSPHFVAAVVAELPQGGKPRFSLGVACRQQWDAAMDKAWLECVQGLLFAGWYTSQPRDEQVSNPADVTSFEQHAAFYTWNPEMWPQLPIFTGRHVKTPKSPAPETSRSAELNALVCGLSDEGVELYGLELTTPDLRQLGVHVMRAASPQLVPLHCHEQFPYLGGTAPNVEWRFPWAISSHFPNPMPHPLG